MQKLYLLKNKKNQNNKKINFLKPADFIYPYFIIDGKNKKLKNPDLDGIYYFSIDELLADISEIVKFGIDKILLFGVIDADLKDKQASYAYKSNNFISRAIIAIKKNFPDLILMVDVCLCPFTDHGHCGIIGQDEKSDWFIDKKETLKILSKIALNYAKSGADFIAPSSMMPGEVDAIRKCLDLAGYERTKILAYSVKYASCFYEVFRLTMDSKPKYYDRSAYQLDFSDNDKFLKKIKLDLKAKADWLMVKPGHAYLDIIYRVKKKYPNIPLVAYHVSGEYMMLKALAKNKYVDEYNAFLEVFIALKRAGADYIISYYANEFLCTY